MSGPFFVSAAGRSRLGSCAAADDAQMRFAFWRWFRHISAASRSDGRSGKGRKVAGEESPGSTETRPMPPGWVARGVRQRASQMNGRHVGATQPYRTRLIDRLAPLSRHRVAARAGGLCQRCADGCRSFKVAQHLSHLGRRPTGAVNQLKFPTSLGFAGQGRGPKQGCSVIDAHICPCCTKSSHIEGFAAFGLTRCGVLTVRAARREMRGAWIRFALHQQY